MAEIGFANFATPTTQIQPAVKHRPFSPKMHRGKDGRAMRGSQPFTIGAEPHGLTEIQLLFDAAGLPRDWIEYSTIVAAYHCTCKFTKLGSRGRRRSGWLGGGGLPNSANFVVPTGSNELNSSSTSVPFIAKKPGSWRAFVREIRYHSKVEPR